MTKKLLAFFSIGLVIFILDILFEDLSDDKTIVTTASDAAIEVTKTGTVTQNDGNLTNGNGDVIVYTFTIENKGNVTLSNLTLTDNLTDAGGGPLSLNSSPTFVSASAGSTSSTLLSSGVVTYTASYTITQSSANTGGVNNSMTVLASSPGNTDDVTDVSDDGDDTDGNTLNDPTVTTITGSPSLEVTKTAAVTDNGDGKTGASDVINYTVTVKNTGDVSLTGLTLVDLFALGIAKGNLIFFKIDLTILCFGNLTPMVFNPALAEE